MVARLHAHLRHHNFRSLHSNGLGGGRGISDRSCLYVHGHQNANHHHLDQRRRYDADGNDGQLARRRDFAFGQAGHIDRGQRYIADNGVSREPANRVAELGLTRNSIGRSLPCRRTRYRMYLRHCWR
jgi:hypothetical protein